MPTVSLDTVYRTLWMLHDLGLVSTLGPKRESVRFDANLAQHHHCVCVRCGLARDFESADLDALRVPEIRQGARQHRGHARRGARRLRPLREGARPRNRETSNPKAPRGKDKPERREEATAAPW